MTKRGIEYLLSDSKRRFDIAGGTALAAALLPAAAVTGVVSAIDTKSFNPLLLQDRVGVGRMRASGR